jgi:putative ABC transport system permease protein
MAGMLKDIRYALRQLRKAPGFALTAILTLAFGIGATTAIFSIVEGVLLRPLPFADPANLVAVGDLIDGASLDGPSATAPELIAYAHDATGFSSLGGYQQTGYEFSGAGDPAQISASRLGASTFPTLGVAPILGRTFTQKEEDTNQAVTVLSYGMWRSRFHGDEQILGKKILLDRKPYEVIGVMPREFEFPLVPGQLNRSELWVPLSLTPGEIASGSSSWNYKMVGRLKPGVSAAAAQQQAQRVPDEIMRRFPELANTVHLHAVVQALNEATVAEARPLVRMLFLAVAVVLFIACANLAGLLLVRVIGRRREIAVRLALGASASAVLRQTMVETLTLSVAGGVLGLGLASVALRIGVSFLPETLPRVSSIGLDWQVVVFALLLALFTGVLCGLAPSLAASRTGINEGLKEGGRTGTVGGGHARLRSALVIVEVAVALVLLTCAGLLLRSFDKLRAVSLGYRTEGALTAGFDLPRQQYSTQATVDAFNELLLRKLQQLPGVQMAGITTQLPGSGQGNSMGFVPEGYAPPTGTALNLAWPSQILGNYFGAAGIPLLRGRIFTDVDNHLSSPPVIIVNRALAEHYWPGQDPIGKRIHIGVVSTPLPWMTVVGEIGDIKQSSAETDTLPQLYIPSGQFKAVLGQFAPPEMLTGSGGNIVLRTSLPPEQMSSALLAAVRSIDPRLPLTSVESMQKVVQEGEAPRRFNTVVISAFAAAALLLALLGVYGVIAFSAALRTQEMAIRLALGSQRANVMQIILASGAKLGLAGCVIGGVIAFFATRLLRSMLFQVDPLDPVVLTLAAIAIFLLAVVASVIPARKAAYVEPVQALRGE